MTVDVMTSHRRIDTAIALGKPDRVPVVPMIDFFASSYAGISQHEMLFDLRRADLAIERTVEDLGPVDGIHLSYGGMGHVFQYLFPTPPVIPGLAGVPADAQLQFVERSVMEPGEYEDIAAMGAFNFLSRKIQAHHPDMPGRYDPYRALATIGLDAARISLSARRWRKKGIEPLVGPNLTFTPLEWVALALRAFNDFAVDLHRHPELVRAGAGGLMDFFKKIGIMLATVSRIKRIFIGGNRTGAAFMSPRQFREFALPEWEEMCWYFVFKGITPVLHFDSDWTPLFAELRSLPRWKCVLNLDGCSDIFRAKEVLGDHMCIMGDVPATMLKLGEPDEVDEYCRRLITEIGADGGFILSSGCTVPPDAKPENVKAMLRSVGRYRP